MGFATVTPVGGTSPQRMTAGGSATLWLVVVLVIASTPVVHGNFTLLDRADCLAPSSLAGLLCQSDADAAALNAASAAAFLVNPVRFPTRVRTDFDCRLGGALGGLYSSNCAADANLLTAMVGGDADFRCAFNYVRMFAWECNSTVLTRLNTVVANVSGAPMSPIRPIPIFT